MDRNRVALWLRRAAFLTLGLFAAFLAFMGVGEMVSGDLSGVQHLVPALLAIGLMLLAVKRPLAAGVILLGLGAAAFALFYNAMIRPEDKLGGATIMGGPFLFSGLLLLVAAALARPASDAGSGA